MITMLDCIKRTPLQLNQILEQWEEMVTPSIEKLADRIATLEQIILVGSGTSNTAAMTSKFFVEKASGLQCRNITPNELVSGISVYPKNALYVFTSQTGTSIVSRQARDLMEEKGLLTLSITASEETPMAQESPLHLLMGCGHEEYPMRTIGYSCSVLVHMLLGVEIGRYRHHLSDRQYEDYMKDARQAADHQLEIIEKTMKWMDQAKHSMLRADCIIFTGADELAGVSLEGAMKVWETPQIPCFGYEIEEGIHGPNYGYNSRHTIIVLSNGRKEQQKLSALARYMKEVHGSGLMVGPEVIDGQDLQLEMKSRDFNALEFAVAVQCIAYHLAIDYGRDMSLPHDNSKMERYFMTHSEPV